MAKYLEVQVVRKESTQIYLRVPVDFDEKSLYRKPSYEVERLVGDQRDSYDFDIDGYDIEGVKVVDREHALPYGVWDMKEGKLLEDCQEDFDELKEEDEQDELLLARRKDPVLPFEGEKK